MFANYLQLRHDGDIPVVKVGEESFLEAALSDTVRIALENVKVVVFVAPCLSLLRSLLYFGLW